MAKGPEAFRTISEVARELDVPQHVLRFWESRFNQVRPMKRRGGRRHYRPEDIALLRGIHKLLYVDGFTIKGVQKILRERGIAHVVGAAKPGDAEVPVTSGAEIVALQPRLASAAQNGGAATGENEAPQSLTGASEADGQTQSVLHAALDELGSLKDILERARS